MTILSERGYFWWAEEQIPDGQTMPPSLYVGGELTVDEDGRISLKLDEPLFEKEVPKTIIISAGKNYDIQRKGICGILKRKREKVFLYGLMGDTTFHKQLNAMDCFIGDKPFVCEAGAFLFKKITFPLKGFEGWLRMGAIQCSQDEDGITAVYKKPKDASYELNGFTLSIEYDIQDSYNLMTSDEITLKQMAFLIISSQEDMPIELMKKKYRLIEDLFILLTNSEYRIDWPTVQLSMNNAPYKHYFFRNKNSAVAPEWHECWTNFILLREQFGRIFATWENKHDLFGSGFYLYLATRRGIPAYVENRFLDLMMGFESFHRHKNPEAADDEAIRLRKKIIQQTTDKAEEKWLKEKLNWAHEPTSKKRLTETLTSIPLDIESKRLEGFARRCIDARNHMVHPSKDKKKEDSGTSLASLDQKNDALAQLYHLLLLSEIGIDEQILNEIIKNRFEIRRDLTAVGLFDEPPPPSNPMPNNATAR